MTVDPSDPPVQAIEVTPGKKLVWALRTLKTLALVREFSYLTFLLRQRM